MPVVHAYASLSHYAEHLAPVLAALPESVRGTLWSPRESAGWGPRLRPRETDGNWMLVAGFADLQRVERHHRMLYIEHGAGQCLAPETLVMTADMRHVPISSLSVGDEIVAFEEAPTDRVWRQWRPATVTALQLLRLPCYELKLEDGTIIVASAEHRWLTRDRQSYEWTLTKNLQDSARWPTRSSKLLRCFDVWSEDRSWEAGYLAAAFDGEGCFTQTRRGTRQNRMMLAFAQKDNAMLAEVEALLRACGFRYSVAKNERSGVAHLSVLGGTREVLRFIGAIRPRRLLDNIEPLMNGQMRGHPVELAELRPIGEQTVVGLGTSTGTLIAEGLASHNSYRGDPRAPQAARSGSYSGGLGLDSVRLFLCPSEAVAWRWREVYEAPAVVVGCPKLDRWHRNAIATEQARDFGPPRTYKAPTVAMTWHWENGLVSEAQSALKHYARALPALVRQMQGRGWQLLGHSHPRSWLRRRGMWRELGVPATPDLAEVFERADLLVADNTSALYEFASLDRPVVVLNAPWYRRDVHHGLRFWDLVPGPQVDEPHELVSTIAACLADDAPWSEVRRDVVAKVYAHRDGTAAARAAAAILEVIG